MAINDMQSWDGVCEWNWVCWVRGECHDCPFGHIADDVQLDVIDLLWVSLEWQDTVDNIMVWWWVM